MVDREQISSEVKKLFDTQRLGVLSTYGSNQPYSSLVAFTASEDLKKARFCYYPFNTKV